MNKKLNYALFIGACFMVFLLFLTATTYTQVAVAVLLYPLVAFMALQVFPRRTRKTQVLSVSLSSSTPRAQVMVTPQIDDADANEVADSDRRAFFKLIGTAGLSFFILSVISRRAELPFIGRLVGGSGTSITNTEGAQIDPSEKQPLDGYQIAEIDDSIVSYYGFSNKTGAWVIMREDTESSSFRYAKGEKNFSSNWAARERISYQYFHDVF